MCFCLRWTTGFKIISVLRINYFMLFFFCLNRSFKTECYSGIRCWWLEQNCQWTVSNWIEKKWQTLCDWFCAKEHTTTEHTRSLNIQLVESKTHYGLSSADLLCFPANNLNISVLFIHSHETNLGRQAQAIKDLKKCKWFRLCICVMKNVIQLGRKMNMNFKGNCTFHMIIGGLWGILTSKDVILQQK